MTTLIVNASSKSKNAYSDKKYKFGEKTFLDGLDKKYQENLLKSRKHLVNDLKIPQGSDLQITQPKTEPEEYLPAYLRYSGRTYSKISEDAWNALNSNKSVDMVILSALYGLIRYDEPIRNYSIKQVDKMSDSRIGTFWKNSGASDWLKNFIINNGYKEVKFVLSTSYSDIVQRDKLIEELNKDHGIDAVERQFKSAGGMASMLERGKYINSYLLDEE